MQIPSSDDQSTFEVPSGEDSVAATSEVAAAAPEAVEKADPPASVEVPASKEKAVEQSEGLFENFKKLSRATSVKIAGEDRPLYGRAHWHFTPYIERKDSDNSGRIPQAFPTLSNAGVSKHAELIKSMDFRHDRSAHLWASNVDSGLNLTNVSDGLTRALNRPGSNWVQVPEHNGDRLTIGLAKSKNFTDTILKESDALLYFLDYMELGVPSQIPLWHSGFWVSFRPCSEEAWVHFNDLLSNDKKVFGRASSGLVFSNINALFKERALQMVMKYVMTHSINFDAEGGREDLLSLIAEPDVNHLLWGFLVANHPNGYPINRGCSGNIGVCKAEISENVFLQWLQITDFNNLTEEQKNHMCRRKKNAVTVAEVKSYQKSLRQCQDREIKILSNDRMELSMVFGIPTAQETINSGNRWLNGIIQMVDQILEKEAGDERRESVYNAHGRSTMMREYSHYVKAIKLNGNIVEESESLDMLLSEISPRATVREAYFKEVANYIENSVVSIIGLPNYVCPVCQKLQNESESLEWADTIPIDVCQAFFNLALLRYMEIVRRT